jgi:hypothetical protein
MPLRTKSSVTCSEVSPMAEDDAGGDRHEVDGVAEVDAVLDPDLRAEQADHPVQDDGDAAEHATGRRGDQRAELRRQAEQDRDRPPAT